jgi:uncharacterized protein YndB with AHSA1/START domain
MSTLQADGEILDARTVRFERLLPGPIERVWAYLTESEKRRKWLAGGAMELRVGGQAKLRFNHSELTPHQETPPDKYKGYDGGKVVVWTVTRYDEPRLLALRWGDQPEDSEVTFELEPRGSDVLLRVTHRRLSSRDFVVNVGAGWQTHLGILIDHLNDRTPSPFWQTRAALETEYDRRIPA